MNGPCWGSSGMKKWDYVKITGERCGQREREEIVIEEMRVEFATNGWDGTQSELLKWCRRLFWWYPTLPHLSRNFRGQKRIFPFFLFKFFLFFSSSICNCHFWCSTKSNLLLAFSLSVLILSIKSQLASTPWLRNHTSTVSYNNQVWTASLWPRGKTGLGQCLHSLNP